MAYDNQGAAVGAAGHYAAAMTSAIITSGGIDGSDLDAVAATFNELLTTTFEQCEALKGTLPESTPAPRKTYNRGGGNSRGNGGGNTDPGSVDFRGGKFRGKTIAEVYEEEPEYLEWCVGNMKNDFMVSRINAFLDTVAA